MYLSEQKEDAVDITTVHGRDCFATRQAMTVMVRLPMFFMVRGCHRLQDNCQKSTPTKTFIGRLCDQSQLILISLSRFLSSTFLIFITFARIKLHWSLLRSLLHFIEKQFCELVFYAVQFPWS